MKKFTFLKTVLTAVCMLVGVNAWADGTVLYERGTTNAWATTDIGTTAGTWSAADYGTAEIIVGTGLKYTSPDNGSGSTTLALATKDNSKLVWSFSWDAGASTGRAGNKNYLKFGDVELRAMGQDQKGYIVIGGVETEIGGKNDVRAAAGSCWVGTITIDKAEGTVTYDITLPSSGKKTGNGIIDSKNFISSVVLGFERGGRTNTSNSTLQKIEIIEEEQEVTTANYTVKYMYGEVELKDAANRSGIVGSAIALSEADKDVIRKDGVKYVYASDDSEGKTISEGAVVTVTFKVADKYDYTLNLVDGEENILKVQATGQQYEGDNQKVYYPRTFKYNGKYYTTTTNGAYPWYGYTFSAAETKNVVYAVDETLTYFFEVEDLSKSHSWAATGSQPDRYSNGLAGRLYKYSYAYTEALEGGIYTLTMWARNNASSSEANIDIYVRNQEGVDGDKINFAENWGTSGQGTKTIENITIPTGSYLVFNNGGEYNSNLEMDYIILTKTGEAPAVTKPVTITSAGWATLYSPYALDFSGVSGLTAYTATYDNSESTVTLTPVNDVPANTGVVLKGVADTYAIPVIVSSETEKGDLKGSATEALTYDQGAEYDYYMLALNGAGEAQFTKLTSGTIAAGKAYLQLPKSAGARTLNVVIAGGETTGISDASRLNDNGEMKNDNFFNLNGQRVEKPTKGLYIKNGKKVIIK